MLQLLTVMCARPFRPRPRRDRDVGHFVLDETETRRSGSETRPSHCSCNRGETYGI